MEAERVDPICSHHLSDDNGGKEKGKARDCGGDIGQTLLGAFQSARNAVAEAVKIGKLDFAASPPR